MARSIGPKNDKQGAQPGRHARAVVRVNRRLVLVTLGVGAALLAATYVVHGFQMERHADTFLARADAAEKDGQIGQAIAFLAHYTQFRPDDTDSLLRLGRLRQQTADDYRQWTGVFFIFEEVLRRNPTHPEAAAIRRDIVDVAMKIGEFDEARVHLEALLATDSDNAELLHLLGLCWHAERKFDKAVRAYLQAIDGTPSVVEFYRPLAELMATEPDAIPDRRELEDLQVSAETKALIPQREASAPPDGDPKEGDEPPPEPEPAPEPAGEPALNPAEIVLARMVEVGRPPHEAYLARASFRQQRDLLEQAREDVEAARQTAPDAPELLLQSASLALQQSDDARLKGDREGRDQHLVIARADAEAGLTQDEDDLRFYSILAQLERQAAGGDESEAERLGHLIEAESYLERGLARVPKLREARTQPAAELTELWVRLNWSLADMMLARAELALDGDAGAAGADGSKKSAKSKAGDPQERKRRQTPKEIFKAVEALTAELSEGGASRSLVDFLNAQMHMVQREWPAASRLLEQSRRRLPSDSEIVERIDLMLGQCFAAMGNPDQQIDVYRRALDRNPRWLPGRLGLAAAYVKAGRVEDGLTAYSLVSGIPGVPEEMARILIVRELGKPEKRQSWDQIPAVLAAAEKLSPDSVQIPILRAQLHVVQKQIDEAVALLDAALEEQPDSADLWAARATLELQRPDIADPAARFRAAEAILQDGLKKAGDAVSLRLAAANAILMLPPEEATRELAQLEQDTDQFTPADRATLYEGLAAAYARAGHRDKAADLWRQVASLQEADLAPLLVLAELAARDQDVPALKRVLGRIRGVEGDSGPTGDYIEALILQDGIFKNEALRREPEKLDEALGRPRQLLARAMVARPSWSGPPRALGGLEWESARAAALSRGADGDEAPGADGLDALLTARQEKAVEYYEIAFRLHDRSRSTIERLVRYYSAKRQFDQADEVLRQVEDDAPSLLSGDLVRLASVVAWQQGNLDESVELAADLAETSESYADQVYLARLRFANGERGESVEKPLREACRIAPEKAEPWLALIEYHVRTDNKEAAQAALEEAREKLAPEPTYYRPLSLARFHEALGERDPAEARYNEALQAAQADPGLAKDKDSRAAVLNGLRAAMVEFYIRGRDREALDKADKILAEMLAPAAGASDEAQSWATRRRALVLASTGAYEDSTKALDLLLRRGADETRAVTAADLRVKAAILARRPTRNDRQELIKTLEALAQRQAIRPDEQQQLAHLYEAEERWTEALETYRQLVEANPASAPFLADYAFALLNRAEQDQSLLPQAEDTVARLESLEPNSFRSATTRATLLYRQGNAAAAVPILQDFLKRLDTIPPEQTFRDLLEQKKLDETLAVLTDLAKNRDDAAARQIAEHVRKLIADGDQEEAIAVLTRYVQASDTVVAVQAELVRITAGLMEQIGQHEAAEETYRNYVKRSPRPQAELILAAFFARRDRVEEALDLCEGAWDGENVVTAATMSVAVLRTGQTAPDQIKRVEGWLQDAMKDAQPEQWRGLATSLADLLDFQRRYDEAILVYREMLSRNDRDVVALNNMAWLLAFQPERRPEALQYINQAIRLAGPLAALLDTRGVVYLQLNKPREALADLGQATQEHPASAVRFHLALAQLRSGDRAAAVKSFQRAKGQGLTRQDLHPSEHADYDRLDALQK